ncbi:hypothetical protein BUALT_Bualt12G0101000 [Buddleja alternifolia]|uniref:F-box domain-containing protein n=1 Tax=Buddleja alternifolia TaxID=168488 RepID=A0AAV6WXC2_9LAMI|nr:hypothetical protein BUALT_Bualt12G0101000 [Buddleja alternifolia]
MELSLKRRKVCCCNTSTAEKIWCNIESSENHRSSAAEKVGGNEDVLIEILTLLPAKPLVRFKSVSKHWQALISAPYFSYSHTQRHLGLRRQPTSFIFQGWGYQNTGKFYYFNPTTQIFVPYCFDYQYTKILQSAHGLLLLEARNTQCGRKDYFVHNPTTRQSRNLFIDNILLCDKSKKRALISGLSLAFDPTRSPYYKVICMRTIDNSRGGNRYRADVYDSETHTWNSGGLGGEAAFTAPSHAKFQNGIFWNNGIYWIRTSVPRSFYFDLDKGSLGTLAGLLKTPWQRRPGKRTRPEVPIKDKEKKNYLMESNGKLHCLTIFSSHELEENSLLIHEMSSDGNNNNNNFGWVEKYREIVNPLVADELDGQVGVLGMVRGGEHEEEDEESSFVLFHVSGKIFTYWFSSGSFKILDLTKHGIYKTHGDNALDIRTSFQFIESLAPHVISGAMLTAKDNPPVTYAIAAFETQNDGQFDRENFNKRPSMLFLLLHGLNLMESALWPLLLLGRLLKLNFTRANPTIDYMLWEEDFEKLQNTILKGDQLPEWYKFTLFNELYFLVAGGTV